MRTTGEVVAKGVLERRFEFEADGETVPGILWRPEGTAAATPSCCSATAGPSTSGRRTSSVSRDGSSGTSATARSRSTPPGTAIAWSTSRRPTSAAATSSAA